MDNSKFEEVVGMAQQEVERKLSCKGEEYGREDRLSNFKRAAAKRMTTPEDILIGFTTKHEISIEDMIDDIDKGKSHAYEQWLEKVTDNIVYHYCLLALIYERTYPKVATVTVPRLETSVPNHLDVKAGAGVPRRFKDQFKPLRRKR